MDLTLIIFDLYPFFILGSLKDIEKFLKSWLVATFKLPQFLKFLSEFVAGLLVKGPLKELERLTYSKLIRLTMGISVVT